MFDGNKHIITVPSVFSSGITLNQFVSNATIKNFNVTHGQFGIIVGGNLNVIANNSIADVSNGFYFTR